MKKIEKLTQDQEEKIPEWVEKYIQIGLSTEPADFEKATNSALKAYELLNLNKPMIILRMGSPYAATIGGAMAFSILKNIGAQVRDQVGDQVWDQVGAQVGAPVGAKVGAQVGGQPRTA